MAARIIPRPTVAQLSLNCHTAIAAAVARSDSLQVSTNVGCRVTNPVHAGR
jgi:hypothetical protein